MTSVIGSALLVTKEREALIILDGDPKMYSSMPDRVNV
jgi:hypothetical protein